ncbi:MAG: RNA polymerase sigma factor [Solirubrobacteraceae bacterium]
MELNTTAQATAWFGRSRPSVGDPDAELVAAAQADPEAFVVLYERYFARVLGYVRLRIADRAAGEDVTSQIFTTALAKLGSFRGHGPFAAWLFRIARNTVHDEYRGRKDMTQSEEALAELPGPEPGPEERVLERERQMQLRAALAELRTDQQHLLALRYGAGMSFEELGAALGVPPGTARVRVHRIVQELRRRYPDEV